MSTYRSSRSGTLITMLLSPIGLIAVSICCMAVLCSLILFRFERPDELQTDFSMTFTRVGWEDDHESDPNKDGFWSNTPISGGSSAQPFDDPTQKGVVAAGMPIGKLESLDEGVQFGISLEDMTIRNANNDIVMSTSEREAGFTNNEENTRIYFGQNMVAEITEREVAFEESETESVYLIVDGQRVGVAQVLENGSISREAIRKGTEVSDYRGDGFALKTEYDTGWGFFWAGAAGAKGYVNGNLAYTVEPVNKSNPGLSYFDALYIKDATGTEVCRIDYDDELFKDSVKLTFACNGETYGVVFIRYLTGYVRYTPSGKYCTGDDGCSYTTWNTSWNLTGQTLEQKIESLKAIDFMMALMPDHINKNNMGLHEVEEFGDALMVLLTEDPETAAQYGVALNQEEDALSVKDAFAFVFGK